jgi:hypothetical protein
MQCTAIRSKFAHAQPTTVCSGVRSRYMAQGGGNVHIHNVTKDNFILASISLSDVSQ